MLNGGARNRELNRFEETKVGALSATVRNFAEM